MNKTLTTQEEQRKRLKFRSWHRGWKEMDLILGHFADAKLSVLSEEELVVYEALLDMDDDVLWAWITGKEAAPDAFAAMIAMLEGYGLQVG